jgi:hypothetical protein
MKATLASAAFAETLDVLQTLSVDITVLRNSVDSFHQEKLSMGEINSFFQSPSVSGPTRVARWYFFKPKIPVWVNFGGS